MMAVMAPEAAVMVCSGDVGGGGNLEHHVGP